jgi:hypothetical protein
MAQIGRFLVVAGAILLLGGLAWMLGPKVAWLGRLPGDIVIERPGFRLYIPLTTSVLLSLLLTGLLRLLRR